MGTKLGTKFGVCMDATEHQIQASYFDWVRLMRNSDWRYNLIYAVPNGAKLPSLKNKSGGRWSPVAKKLIAEGLTSGVWDVSCDVPIVDWVTGVVRPGFKMEFKSAKGKLTDNQKEWGEWANICGWMLAVIRSFEEAKLITEGWMTSAGDGESVKRIIAPQQFRPLGL